jgi:hypothetical protein
LICQCKKNESNFNNLYKIIARKCAISTVHLDKEHVASCLSKIVVQYDLVRNWSEFLLENCNPQKWWTKQEKPYIDNLIEELISKLCVRKLKNFRGIAHPQGFVIDVKRIID